MSTRPLVRTVLSSLVAAALAFPAAAFAAEPAWVTKSNDNAKVLLNVLAKYSPEGASNLGVEGYDEQITDMSRDQFEATNKVLRAAIAEYQKRLKAESDPKVKQDLEILIGKANDQIRTAALVAQAGGPVPAGALPPPAAPAPGERPAAMRLTG